MEQSPKIGKFIFDIGALNCEYMADIYVLSSTEAAVRSGSSK